MAGKTPAKKTASKSSDKKTVKIKDLAPRKDPRGGNTDHPPKSGGKTDY